ncbi:KTSC domain-containing protein [Oscillatoria salina]|uniref:KTSC domain-containing protein n=1 Tax=Oscillatoria salina TaxID=331517 RepID=UPI0013BB68FD|nr:KTSC domain-containing protein [Oscillatoria salina]MBZ8180190.1 KTSC domain-containing protein [Oscillatoria salina IIICB1]NET90264.1 KTSC domain-containing protein [Kamptonema sp. SIO1D9]
MKLNKIDLTKIVAVGHEQDKLGLLIDRGKDVEYVEISAPTAAYQGLQQVNNLAAGKTITREPVNSSMAAAIAYNQTEKKLQVEFLSGSVYQYDNVEAEIWQELRYSDSTGKYYNSRIKGQYSCQRIDEETVAESGTFEIKKKP